MSETEINSNNSNVTEVNASGNNATVINSDAGGGAVAVGTVLCGKYEVKKKLDIASGEADLYICTYKQKEYIAKVYRRQFAIKDEVINLLKQIDSPFVAKLFDNGTVNGYPFEILPYYKNGSIQGKLYSFEDLKNTIIPCVNEGLKVLHDKGIIHKDLKPSNIMLNDDKKTVSIIDFGISSVLTDGNTVIMTKTGMTPEYSAPETFRSLFLEESDYYSFGIMIFELFCGHSPYAKMSDEDKAKYATIQKIPTPDNMPKELAELISALTYFDITNRHSKNNPNRRWVYDEVKNWCNGEKQVIPGDGVEFTKTDMKPYSFNNKEFTEVSALVRELALHWNDGKKELFRGYLSAHFANSSNQKLARICDDAGEKAQNSGSNEDLIFLETIYKLAPNTNAFYWKGRRFGNLQELGQAMLEKLCKNDTADYSFYESVLKEKLLTKFIELKSIDKRNLRNAAKNIEDMYAVEGKTNPTKVYFLMAYMLSEEKTFYFDGKRFKSVGELAEYIKSLLDLSYEKFKTACHKLVDGNGSLNTQFECWLLSLGKKDELNRWKNSLK